MHITIREAAINDAEAIKHLSNQLGYNTTIAGTAERMQRIIADNTHCVFVAVAAGEVIGWIHSYQAIRLESDPFTEIGGLVVDTKARGLGVGEKLVQQVIEWSLSKSITRLRVRTNTSRIGTHRFYRKLGFIEIKEQKVYDLKLPQTLQESRSNN